MRMARRDGRDAIIVCFAVVLGLSIVARADTVLSHAKEIIAEATAPASVWNGPTTGPRAATDKTIVFIAGDLRNGGIQGVSDGVKQAGAKIGWKIRVLDGQGTVP